MTTIQLKINQDRVTVIKDGGIISFIVPETMTGKDLKKFKGYYKHSKKF